MKSLLKIQAIVLSLTLLAVSFTFVSGQGGQSQASPDRSVFITEVQYFGSVGISDSSQSSPGIINRWDKWIEISNYSSDVINLQKYSFEFGSGSTEYHTYQFPAYLMSPGSSVTVGMARDGVESSFRPTFTSGAVKNMSRTSDDPFTSARLFRDGELMESIEWGAGDMNAFDSHFLTQTTDITASHLRNDVSYSIQKANGLWQPSIAIYNGNNYGTPGTAVIPVNPVVVTEVETPVTDDVQTAPEAQVENVPVEQPVVSLEDVQSPESTHQINEPLTLPEPEKQVTAHSQEQNVVLPPVEVAIVSNDIAAEGEEIIEKPQIILSGLETSMQLNPQVKPSQLASTPVVNTGPTSELTYSFFIPWRTIMYAALGLAILALSQMIGWSMKLNKAEKYQEVLVNI